MLDAAFSFLGNETNGRALGILGAVIAAFCIAGWSLFKYFRGETRIGQNGDFLSLSQYQAILKQERERIAFEVEAETADEREELLRRRDELNRKLADIDDAYQKSLEQNKELSERIANLSKFADRSDFEEAARALRERRLDEAQILFNKSLVALDPVSKDIAAIYLGLGMTSEEKGDWPSAAKSYSAALAINEDTYTLGQASKFLWLSGAPHDAIRLSARLLDLNIKQFGRRSLATASALNLLSGQLYDVREMDEARSRLRDSLSILEELGETRDHRYASSLANLANIHLVEGDYKTSIDLIQKALASLPNPDTEIELILAMKNSLAEALRLDGQSAESLSLMERNLEEAVRHFGQIHPHTARALNFLAKAQLSQGQVDFALANLREAFNVQKQCLGEFHFNTMAIAGNIIELVGDHPRLETDDIRALKALYGRFLVSSDGEKTHE